MDILYTSDNYFVPQIAASMCSICENNKEAEKIHFHIFCDRYTEENITNLKKFVESYSRTLSLYDVSDLRRFFKHDFDHGGWKPVALARLLTDKILPESVDRVIYLDGDTIIRGSLAEFWETDFCGCSVAGVIEPTVNKKNLIPIDLLDSPYINSGVLLLNVKKWREQGVGDRLLDYFREKHDMLFAPDQDAINGALKGDILFVSPKYNFCNSFYTYNYKTLCKMMEPIHYIDEAVFVDACANPVIVHYLGEERPWRKGNKHKYRTEFEKYLNMTPWKDSIVNEDWRLYFCLFYLFNFFMKPFPMIRYRIITKLIPAFIKYRATMLKKH